MSKLTVLRERMHSLPETPCKPFAGVSTTMPPKQRSSAPALLETRARQEPHRRRRKRSTTAPLLDPTARPFVKTPSSSSVNLGQIARADDPILIDLSMSVASEAQEPPAATWNYLVDQQYPEKTPVPSHKAIPEATEPTPALTPSTPSRTPRKLSGLSPAMRGVKSLKLVADECGCCGKKTNDKELTTINPCKHLLCFHCVSAMLNVICTTRGPTAKARCAACGDIVQGVIPNVLNAPEVRQANHKLSTTTVPAIVRLDNVPAQVKLADVVSFVGAENLQAMPHPVHLLFDVQAKRMRSHVYVEVRSRRCAHKIMKEKQSAQIGGKPVIVTMAKEEQLLDDLRPESRQELMSLLEHVSDVPDSPALYTILSILCKLESTHVELFWDMFHVAAGKILARLLCTSDPQLPGAIACLAKVHGLSSLMAPQTTALQTLLELFQQKFGIRVAAS